MSRFAKVVVHLNRLPEVFRCRRHTADWFKLSAAYIGFKTHLPFEIRMASGSFEFRETSDIATFWQIFYRRVYRVDPGDISILDAGANIGAFTLYALQTAPQARVIAVEPAPDSCGRIRSLLRLHGLESRCALHQVALGRIRGETTIQLNVGSQFRRSGLDGERVQMETLASLLQGKTLDLLKMDIEGAEYEVLDSLPPSLLRGIKRIVLEYHPNASPQKAIQPLISNGFRIAYEQDDGEGYGLLCFEQIESLQYQSAGSGM